MSRGRNRQARVQWGLLFALFWSPLARASTGPELPGVEPRGGDVPLVATLLVFAQDDLEAVDEETGAALRVERGDKAPLSRVHGDLVRVHATHDGQRYAVRFLDTRGRAKVDRWETVPLVGGRFVARAAWRPPPLGPPKVGEPRRTETGLLHGGFVQLEVETDAQFLKVEASNRYATVTRYERAGQWHGHFWPFFGAQPADSEPTVFRYQGVCLDGTVSPLSEPVRVRPPLDLDAVSLPRFVGDAWLEHPLLFTTVLGLGVGALSLVVWRLRGARRRGVS